MTKTKPRYDPDQPPPEEYWDSRYWRGGMAARLRKEEPDRKKPCWTLCVHKRGRNHFYFSFDLKEFLWDGKAWRPTGRSYPVKNVNRAFKQADWWGHLPKQGRGPGGGRKKKE